MPHTPEHMHSGSEAARSGMPTGQRISRMLRNIGDVLTPGGGYARKERARQAEVMIGASNRAAAEGMGRSGGEQLRQEEFRASNARGYNRQANEYAQGLLDFGSNSPFAPSPPDSSLKNPEKKDPFGY